MADPGITATFSDLPTEMKATIFGYLRQNDHKTSACLVSRGWRDIMAPILWEHLTLEIATTLPGELACLLNPNDGVLAHVRSIDIRPGLDDPEEFELNSEFGIAFRLIFGALQKNCLSTLRFYIDISMTTLLSVLQSQQALETLRLQGLTSNGSLSNDLCLATHSSWVTPTLRNIRYLRVTVSDGEQNTYEHSAFLVKNTPKLKYLNLDGFVDPLPDWYGNDALGEPGAATQSLQLVRFQLCWLDLMTYPASLFKAIDFSVLRDLIIGECGNVGAFLTALVPGASQVPALKRLEMVSSLLPPSDASLQAIETLVTSTPSLQTLWLDVGKGRLIDVACLAGHGNTLKRLGLAASSRTQGPYYSALDLDKLLTQAPKLVDLAVSLCPINLGHVRHLGAKFKLFKQTGNDYVLSETEFLLAFATEVFRLLVRNGSNIRALAMSPEDMNSAKRPILDDNGHRWLRYYYRYDVTGAMGGQEHVVAVPTRPAEFPISVPP
ncbi:hypothetical protein AALT_g10759 [Alternaria alternata]|nr:hypothetical protein AALT_g10759 [Alternaria alternata]